MCLGDTMFENVKNYDLMLNYAAMIFESNKKFNLSGHKTYEEIKEDLIDNTLSDLLPGCVPRGTLFADIGTGSGIPGMVIAIGNPEVQGVLIEANNKKVEFMKEVSAALNISNVTIVCARAEEYCKINRDMYDLCLTRAFGPIYYSIEFAFPILKEGGALCVFSRKNASVLSDEMRNHLQSCGGSIVRGEGSDLRLFSSERGITLYKTAPTPRKYPRRFPVIKREAAMTIEFSDEG